MSFMLLLAALHAAWNGRRSKVTHFPCRFVTDRFACRFVTLIDVLYEKHIRLFCSAEAEPMDLFANIMTMQDARSQKSKMVGASCLLLLLHAAMHM